MSAMKQVNREHEKQVLRFLKILSLKMKTGLRIEILETRFALQYNDRTHHFPLDLLNKMISDGYIKSSGRSVFLTDKGFSTLKEKLGLKNNPSAVEQSSGAHEVVKPASGNRVQVNPGESPLARLYTRNFGKGNTYISDNQFRAGERLRADFEQGQLQPKLSARFEQSAGTSKDRLYSVADISDFAIDSRKRLYDALDSLDPELGGVALDICCFLKGFELVERERQWPPRSAKLMLRTALAILARHYGYENPQRGGSQTIKTWAVEDYRPSIL